MSPSKKRIKLSGSAFKKLKKQRLESDVKLQKVFAKWIKKSEDQTEQPGKNIFIDRFSSQNHK